MFLANNLKKFRKERKLTQQQLSEISGVSRVAIARYEKNQQTPRLAALEKLATALNIPVSQLTDDGQYYNALENRTASILKTHMQNKVEATSTENPSSLELLYGFQYFLLYNNINIYTASDSELIKCFADFLKDYREFKQERLAPSAGASIEKE